MAVERSRNPMVYLWCKPIFLCELFGLRVFELFAVRVATKVFKKTKYIKKIRWSITLTWNDSRWDLSSLPQAYIIEHVDLDSGTWLSILTVVRHLGEIFGKCMCYTCMCNTYVSIYVDRWIGNVTQKQINSLVNKVQNRPMFMECDNQRDILNQWEKVELVRNWDILL